MSSDGTKAKKSHYSKVYKGEKKLVSFASKIHRDFSKRHGDIKISKKVVLAANEYAKNITASVIEYCSTLLSKDDQKIATDTTISLALRSVMGRKDAPEAVVAKDYFGVSIPKLHRIFAAAGIRSGKKGLPVIATALSDFLDGMLESAAGLVKKEGVSTLKLRHLAVAYICGLKDGSWIDGGAAFNSTVLPYAKAENAKEEALACKGAPKPKKARKSSGRKSRKSKSGKRRKSSKKGRKSSKSYDCFC